MLRFLSSLFSSVFVLSIIFIVMMLSVFWHFSQSLPEYKQLETYEPPITSRLYADDGTLLAEYAKEKRVFVPIERIPDMLKQAFMAAEDKSFYYHIGIDVVAIIRAAATNFKNYFTGGALVGASTITQQVAKNFLLTNERTLTRKIKEAILALKMERAFTKDHIMELYLNEIFLGNSSYGVVAAALNYFNKDLPELTLGEMAFLAALPKAPAHYNPVKHYDNAIARRNWVLDRMVENGAITREQAELAKEEDIIMARRPKDETVNNAEYFAEEVRREVVNTMGEESIYMGGLSIHTSIVPKIQEIAYRTLIDGLITYDRNHGYRGALGSIKIDDNWAEQLAEFAVPPETLPEWKKAVVLSTTKTQAAIGFDDGSIGVIPISELYWAREARAAQTVGPEIGKVSQVVTKGDIILVEPVEIKKDKKKEENAVASVENGEEEAQTYGLRQIPAVDGAMVVMDPHTGRVWALVGGFSFKRSQFNRAVQAFRQPGSAFKPFVYAAALDSGYTPSSLILDAPFVLDQGYGKPKWKPHNYNTNFYGPTTLRMGLEHSRNLMTVRLAQAVGMKKVSKYARKFGISDKLEPLLAMSLGSGETTLLRLTNAYAILVNGGNKVSPTLIDRIQDRNGKTIYKSDNRVCEACSFDFEEGLQPPILTDDMEQVTDPMTAYQMVNIMQGVIERGTGYLGRVWGRPLGGKTGTSDNLNDAWFVGFSPDMVVGIFIGFDTPSTLGKRSTGGVVNGPIFKNFMTQVLKGQPAIPFRVPSGIKLVRVNRKTGRPAKNYDDTVVLEAFKPGTENTMTDTIVGSEFYEEPEEEIEIPVGDGEGERGESGSEDASISPNKVPEKEPAKEQEEESVNIEEWGGDVDMPGVGGVF